MNGAWLTSSFHARAGVLAPEAIASERKEEGGGKKKNNKSMDDMRPSASALGSHSSLSVFDRPAPAPGLPGNFCFHAAGGRGTIENPVAPSVAMAISPGFSPGLFS